MNALPRWSEHRALALSWVALVVAAILVAVVARWMLTGQGDRVAFTDVVGAVIVRGKVFRAECPSSSTGSTSDVTCATAEMVDGRAVDPAIFDIEALKRQATSP